MLAFAVMTCVFRTTVSVGWNPVAFLTPHTCCFRSLDKAKRNPGALNRNDRCLVAQMSQLSYYPFTMSGRGLRKGPKICIIKPMKHLTTLLAIYCLSLTSAHADVTEYDFELIIFEDISRRYANSERWQHKLAAPGTETSAVETANRGTRANTTDTNTALNIKQINGIGLSKYAKKLASSKRYHVLVHKSWRQTGFADDAAIDIPIDSRLTDKANTNNIQGSIKIVLERYLHIYTNLMYQQPRKDAVPVWDGQASQQYKEYPINFHRRMRSKELHYVDHPIVGILVKAMPVKKQEASQDKT